MPGKHTLLYEIISDIMLLELHCNITLSVSKQLLGDNIISILPACARRSNTVSSALHIIGPKL